MGKTRPSIYELPEPYRFYGKACKRDLTGVKEASSDWKYPVLSEGR